MNVDVHLDSGWARGPDKRSTNGRMMMISGTVVKVEHTRVACVEHGRSRELRGHHRSS